MSFAQIKYVVDESMLKTEEDESEELDAAPTPPTQHRVRFNPEHHIMLEEAQKIKRTPRPATRWLSRWKQKTILE